MRISDLIHTELDPLARLGVRMGSSSSSSRRRFRARGTTSVSGSARSASVNSFGNTTDRFFDPPGLWRYHVLRETKPPRQRLHPHLCRGSRLAIL